jgi:hypothetical protein
MRQKITAILLLVLGIAAPGSTVYGAPPKGDSKPKKCAKDTDCKGDRICVEGACKPPAGLIGAFAGNSK